MNRIIIFVYLFCTILLAQGEEVNKQKINQLKKKLAKEQKQIEELHDYVEKLENLDLENITEESLKDFPERIKNTFFPKKKKSIVEQLQEFKSRLDSHEAELRRRVGIINVTYREGKYEFPGNDGEVTFRNFSFLKKEKNSLLRITYNDTFMLLSSGRAHWLIKIDSQEKLRFQMYAKDDNHHRIGTFIGYVTGIPKGEHTISIFVKTDQGNSHLGYNGNKFLLQVEEIATENIDIKNQ